MTSTNNAVGTLLQVAGGLITAVYALRALFAVNLMGGGIAFEIFLQGLIFGVLLVGFGEVVKLLQGLFNQREPEPPRVGKATAGGYRVLQDSNDRTVSAETQNRIREFYEKKGLAADEIEATPYEGYVIVRREGKRDIVDLNGFRPEILSGLEVSRHPDLKDL